VRTALVTRKREEGIVVREKGKATKKKGSSIRGRRSWLFNYIRRGKIAIPRGQIFNRIEVPSRFPNF
jgi:hypothetical protein